MTTARRDTDERIHRIFRDELHVEVPTSETDLFESGALDSLAFVDLLVALADAFGREVSIDELDIADFRTIAAIAAFVDGSREAAAS